MPPRHMKSICVSVMFPTWHWIHHPNEKYLCGSSNMDLSMRDSIKCRDIITSPWYEDRWGGRFQLSDDQNQKKVFKNNEQGERRACSSDGKVTGQGGDILIADDLNDMNDIKYEKKRENVLHFWNNAFSTRENNANDSRKIVMQQRGHDSDVAGDVRSKLALIPYTILSLPAIAKEDKEWISPLTGKLLKSVKKGDILWPEMFSQETLDKRKAQLGANAFEAQFQQEPVVDGGGIWNINWFKYIHAMVPKPMQTIISWDTAFKDGQDNDYSVGTVWQEYSKGYILVDLVRERMQYPELKKECVRLQNKWNATKILIEDKASGQSLIQEMKRTFGGRVKPINPLGDKIERAAVVSSAIEGGFVKILENQPWIDDLMYEIKRFPLGNHDDQVDSISQALCFLLKLTKKSPQLRSW